MASNHTSRPPIWFNINPQAPARPLAPQTTEVFEVYHDYHSRWAYPRDDYYSITCMPIHQNFSFEELRLNDNYHGKGLVARRPANDKFTAEANGLAFAHLPPPAFGYGGSNITCRIPVGEGLKLDSPIITFKVGKNPPLDFVVHESLVAPRSEFVRLALKNDWKEARGRIIPMPDDMPEAFKLYQQWLYTNRIPSNSFGNSNDDAKEYELLVRVFILGEKLMDSTFKDATIDCIVHKLQQSSYFDPRLTNLVYDNTPTHSHLRQLWRDIYVWSGNANWLNEETLGDFIHAEFTLDLSKYQMSLSRGEGPRNAPYMVSSCLYHKHADGVCYRFGGPSLEIIDAYVLWNNRG